MHQADPARRRASACCSRIASVNTSILPLFFFCQALRCFHERHRIGDRVNFVAWIYSWHSTASYDDRRRRQAQGQAKAKAEGRYRGRPEDAERNDGIARMLAVGQSWGTIQNATGCSRATIAKIAKRIKQAA